MMIEFPCKSLIAALPPPLCPFRSCEIFKCRSEGSKGLMQFCHSDGGNETFNWGTGEGERFLLWKVARYRGGHPGVGRCRGPDGLQSVGSSLRYWGKIKYPLSSGKNFLHGRFWFWRNSWFMISQTIAAVSSKQIKLFNSRMDSLFPTRRTYQDTQMISEKKTIPDLILRNMYQIVTKNIYRNKR